MRKILRREHDDMVKQLKWKLFQAGHKPWFETFLTFVVALSNVEYVQSNAVGWMKCQERSVSVKTCSQCLTSLMPLCRRCGLVLMVTSGLGGNGQKIEVEVLHEIRLLTRSHKREVSALSIQSRKRP